MDPLIYDSSSRVLRLTLVWRGRFRVGYQSKTDTIVLNYNYLLYLQYTSLWFLCNALRVHGYSQEPPSAQFHSREVLHFGWSGADEHLHTQNFIAKQLLGKEQEERERERDSKQD